LRFVPDNKTVVLGLVTTKRPELEKSRDLVQRTKAAAKYLPLDNVCLSPQCGFSSTYHGNEISESDQWAKLALVVKTAREIWGNT
jgi:5-methyltetrahydropteroyltriglutamate--homocysteine methyltransferase